MGDIRVDLRNRDAQSLTGDKFSSVNVESRGSSALTSGRPGPLPATEARGRALKMARPVAGATASIREAIGRKVLLKTREQETHLLSAVLRNLAMKFVVPYVVELRLQSSLQ